MGAEEALVQFAVLCARELAPPGGELEHGVRRLTRHDLDQSRMSEEVALAHGVGEVLLPGVLRVARPERRVDAAGGEHGVCVQPRALPEDEHLHARLCGSDGGAAAGRAGADDEDVGRLGSMHELIVHPTASAYDYGA